MQVQRQYALKQIFMKIEFENSIRRLSILCRLPDIRIAWINPSARSCSLQKLLQLWSFDLYKDRVATKKSK